jgi:hypothetical protein
MLNWYVFMNILRLSIVILWILGLIFVVIIKWIVLWWFYNHIIVYTAICLTTFIFIQLWLNRFLFKWRLVFILLLITIILLIISLIKTATSIPLLLLLLYLFNYSLALYFNLTIYLCRLFFSFIYHISSIHHITIYYPPHLLSISL